MGYDVRENVIYFVYNILSYLYVLLECIVAVLDET